MRAPDLSLRLTNHDRPRRFVAGTWSRLFPGQTAMIDTPFMTGLELDPARIITSSPA
jgi:hypothetical protein